MFQDKDFNKVLLQVCWIHVSLGYKPATQKALCLLCPITFGNESETPYITSTAFFYLIFPQPKLDTQRGRSTVP